MVELGVLDRKATEMVLISRKTPARNRADNHHTEHFRRSQLEAWGSRDGVVQL
jgi:hypothetical protein